MSKIPVVNTPVVDLVTIAEFKCPYCGLAAWVVLSDGEPFVAHQLPYKDCKYTTLDADEYVRQAMTPQRAANEAVKKVSN